MTRAEEIKEYCVRLNLCYIQQKLNSMIIKAQEEKPTYMDFLANSLRMEAELRESHTRELRVKMSRIPPKHVARCGNDALAADQYVSGNGFV